MRSIMLCGLIGLTLQGAQAQSVPTDPASLAAGKKLFRTNCVSCHGLDGKGDPAMSATLDPKPRNFVTEEFKHGDSDKDIFRTITKGSPGTAMAGFGSKLDDRSRWQLVAFVKSLRHKR